MAFSQTTASSLEDAVSQLVAFAVANAGFTNQGTTVVGSVTHYRISKGGIYWTLWGELVSGWNRIRGRMSYSIASGVAPTSSNGQYDATSMSAWAFPGPYPTLYLYTEGTCVFMVLEITNGIFNHFAIGNITKTETFTGGEFVSGGHYEYRTPSLTYVLSNAYTGPPFAGSTGGHYRTTALAYVRTIRAGGSVNGNYTDFAPFGRNIDNQLARGCGLNSIQTPLMEDSPNEATMRTPLYPNYVHIWDPVTRLYYASGYVPGMRLVPMKAVDPGEIIFTDWQVFPFTQKEGDGRACPVSGNWGLAYQRVP